MRGTAAGAWPFASRISPTLLFLLLFFLTPVGVLFAYSLATSTFVTLEFGLSLDSYREAVTTSQFMAVLWRSIWIGVLTAAICIVVAYPFVYAITLGPLRRHGELFLFLTLVSLFSAYIVRVYAWRTLFGKNGVINSGLQAAGIIGEPLEFLLFSRFAVIVTFVNVLVPLAVLPLYAALTGVDRDLLAASRNLGASALRTFWRVTLPLSSRGVLAAFSLCFVIAAGDYVTPQLVGGPSGLLLGNVIVRRFGVAFDWPLGSALAFILVAAMGLTVLVVALGFRLLGLRDRPA